ncbi:MAG: hypothetical protein HY055_17650 [Magnetospirillum sp.]|nr:hypothetical protein [Magnetospirillum sp.]
MTHWTTLINAGSDLTRAFALLDQASEIGSLTAAAIITRMGLMDAARQAVARANRQLGRGDL